MHKKITRRHFLNTTATGSIALMAGGWRAAPGPDFAGDLHDLSFSLSADWAKALLEKQVLDSSRTDDYGGLFSAGEQHVPGRAGDSFYPFLHMAHRTGNSRYLDAAVLLYRWMERRVSQPDGSWLNEPVKNSWKGPTVFTSIALCEALRFHGSLLDPAFKKTVEDRLLKAGNFVYDNVTIDYGNINYPLSASYAMSLLGEQLDMPRFKERGKALARQGLSFFSKKDGFIFGEGTPYDEPSKKGCFPIDLGYNVEETLPSLAMYGLLTKDEEMLQAVTHSLQTHLEFLLPDGGWDNSWGTRNFKWTYWGSRTSDGCQPAYALLAGRDPRFLRAALLNTRLLRQCTQDGLLQGGPHCKGHHVTPSIHHTFCHLKALTTILDHGIPSAGESKTTQAALPRETAYGTRFFADIQTWLISNGPFRATVTAYDREYKNLTNGHATGGALSMLWHERTGPLLVASMNAYQLVEPGNMPADTDSLSMPLTPRVEWEADGAVYMNIADGTATVSVNQSGGVIVVTTHGRLVDKDQKDPAGGPIACKTVYMFTAASVRLSFVCEKTADDRRLRFVVPVISPASDYVQVNDNRNLQIKKGRATVRVSSDTTIQRLPTTGDRIFNFVPGLEALPLAFLGREAQLEISVID